MTEREQARAAARRLAIIRHAQEVTGNVAFTCRYCGTDVPNLHTKHASDECPRQCLVSRHSSALSRDIVPTSGGRGRRCRLRG
jgi:hypothetical protein